MGSCVWGMVWCVLCGYRASMVQCLVFMLGVVGVLGQNSDIYWGSYDLTIPGGSGAGNAVQLLSLPENAPESFKFAAFKNQPVAAPQFNAVAVQAPQVAAARQSPRPAPKPAPQSAPRPVSRPAPRLAPRPAPRPAPVQVPHQVRPAPEPQQLRGFQRQPTARQPQRIRPVQQQFRQAPQPAQAAPQPTQAVPQTQRFQNFAARTEQKPIKSAPQKKLQPVAAVSEVLTDDVNEVAAEDISNLSRFQLYQLRKKQEQQQKESAKIEESEQIEVSAVQSKEIQEPTSNKAAPLRARAGIRRKVLRKKKVGGSV